LKDQQQFFHRKYPGEAAMVIRQVIINAAAILGKKLL